MREPPFMAPVLLLQLRIQMPVAVVLMQSAI
jgi:hypothetical protein